VPVSIAMNLTVPDYVTVHNIDYLKQLVEKGPLEWPGAKYIIRDDGVKIDFRYIRYINCYICMFIIFIFHFIRL